MSIFILYLQMLAILQVKLSTNAARKIWENRLITPGPWILSWFIDVGGCESSNCYQILESKDIKKHQKKPCHNDIKKNHENSMQAEKSARHWNIIDQTCWNCGLLNKNMSYTVQYLATMTKKILSVSRLWLSDETYWNVTKNKSLNLIVEKHFARLSNWIASNTKEQQSSEGSTWFPTFHHTQTSSNNSFFQERFTHNMIQCGALKA